MVAETEQLSKSVQRRVDYLASFTRRARLWGVALPVDHVTNEVKR